MVRDTVRHLERQTRLPDEVLISAVQPSDARDVTAANFAVTTIYGEKGLCRQRNAALAVLADKADAILFLDDDFVPADDYLAALEQLFDQQPDLCGATGHVIADGINGTGYSFAQAAELVARNVPPATPATWPVKSLYGCNMAIRLSAAKGLRFDEALPLYGWLEDIDFTYRVGREGRLVRTQALRGVHMGTKSGRTSGLKLGYSQIANPVHLLRKRTVPPRQAFRLMRNNLLANIGRSLRPEPHIDRPGRLRGNMLAIGDFLRGRLDPRRILDLD